MFTAEQIKQLEAPLERRFVKPPPKGRFGDYVEGWHCIAEANRIFGFDGWTRETTVTLLGEPRQVDGKWIVNYSGKVRIAVSSFLVREGCGFGQGIDRDLGRAHESALKEAETDAMKRALMTFGNPFGLALYDKKQENVTDGRSVSDGPEGQETHESRQQGSNGREGGITPAPEGPDFWSCQGHVGMNASQAKKAGLDAMHEKMREDIRGLHTDAARREWIEANLSDIRKMPQSWRTILRLEMEEQADMRPHVA